MDNFGIKARNTEMKSKLCQQYKNLNLYFENFTKTVNLIEIAVNLSAGRI